MDLDRTLKWATGIAGYGAVTAWTFAAGYFRVIGDGWMARLSADEVVSLSWPAIQFLVTTVVLLALLYVLVRDRLAAFREFTPPAWTMMAAIALIIAGVGLYAAGRYHDEILPYAYYAAAAGVAVGAACMLLVSRSWAMGMAPAIVISAAGVALCSFLVGSAKASALLHQALHEQVYLTSGKVLCTHVAFASDRGIIVVDGVGKPRVFLKDDQYNAVSSRQACGQTTASTTTITPTKPIVASPEKH